MNQQGFNFEDNRWYHKLKQSNSWAFILDFTCNCCRLQKSKKFSRNLGQFKCVTRETIYHISFTELLIQNIQSQCPELVQKPRITLKILYFSGDHQVFQISSLYDRGKKTYSFIGQGGITWDWGGNFRKFIDRGSHHDTSHWGNWTGCMTGCTKFIPIVFTGKLWWNTLSPFLQYSYSRYIPC